MNVKNIAIVGDKDDPHGKIKTEIHAEAMKTLFL